MSNAPARQLSIEEVESVFTHFNNNHLDFHVEVQDGEDRFILEVIDVRGAKSLISLSKFTSKTLRKIELREVSKLAVAKSFEQTLDQFEWVSPRLSDGTLGLQVVTLDYGGRTSTVRFN